MAPHTSQRGHHPPGHFPRPIRGLAALSRLLSYLEGVGIGLCLLSLISLAVFQFLSRNLRQHGQLWVPLAPDWIDGVIRHSVFLLGFLGAAYATFTGRHIRIDAITRQLRPRRRMVLRIVTTLFVLAICGALLKGGREFLEITRGEQDELSQQGQIFNSVRGALIILGGLGLMSFHFFVQLCIDAVWVLSGEPPPGWWVAEASHGNEAPSVTPSLPPEPPEAPQPRDASDAEITSPERPSRRMAIMADAANERRPSQ